MREKVSHFCIICEKLFVGVETLKRCESCRKAESIRKSESALLRSLIVKNKLLKLKAFEKRAKYITDCEKKLRRLNKLECLYQTCLKVFCVNKNAGIEKLTKEILKHEQV